MLLRQLRNLKMRRLQGSMRLMSSRATVAQRVHGPVGLITGNFSFFTKLEAATIKSALRKGKLLVIVYDRDSIAVPANERAMWILNSFNHHPNLEVRVGYNPPPDGGGHEDRYPEYIKKQLPQGIKVTSIHCKNPYSTLLAKHFQVPLLSISDVSFKELEDIIRQNPKSHTSLNLFHCYSSHHIPF